MAQLSAMKSDVEGLAADPFDVYSEPARVDRRRQENEVARWAGAPLEPACMTHERAADAPADERQLVLAADERRASRMPQGSASQT